MGGSGHVRAGSSAPSIQLHSHLHLRALSGGVVVSTILTSHRGAAVVPCSWSMRVANTAACSRIGAGRASIASLAGSAPTWSRSSCMPTACSQTAERNCGRQCVRARACVHQQPRRAASHPRPGNCTCQEPVRSTTACRATTQTRSKLPFPTLGSSLTTGTTTDARTHGRTDARTHGRTGARAHGRTDAWAHRREPRSCGTCMFAPTACAPPSAHAFVHASRNCQGNTDLSAVAGRMRTELPRLPHARVQLP